MDLLETMDVPTGLMATRLRLRRGELEHAISPEMLDRFAAGSATRVERRAVIRHLLKGCPSCSERVGRSLALGHAEEPEDVYDEAFDDCLEHAFDVLTLRRQEEWETPAARS